MSRPGVPPVGFRLLAITPPQGPIGPDAITPWLKAGAQHHGIAVLFREINAPPETALGPGGRLAALLAGCRAHGVPALLSVGPARARQAIPLLEGHGLQGLQIRGDPPPAVLEQLGPRLPRCWLGRSVHGTPQGRHETVDYSCLAPVFQPKTPQPGVDKRAAGIDRLRAWCRQPGAHVFALGGVTPATATDCLHAGAAGLAGIRSFFGDPSRVTQDVRGLCAALAAHGWDHVPPAPRRR